jgi:hypothetical protein
MIDRPTHNDPLFATAGRPESPCLCVQRPSNTLATDLTPHELPVIAPLTFPTRQRTPTR